MYTVSAIVGAMYVTVTVSAMVSAMYVTVYCSTYKCIESVV